MKTFVGNTFPEPVVPTPGAAGPNEPLNLGAGGGIVASPFTQGIAPIPGGSPAPAETGQIQMAPTGGDYGPGPGHVPFPSIPGSGMDKAIKG